MQYIRYIVLYVLFTFYLLLLLVGPRPIMEYFRYIVLDVLITAFLWGVWVALFFMYLKESQVIRMFEEEPYTERAQPRARARRFPG